MASAQSSPFDRLSDDLIVQILEKVAACSVDDPFRSVRGFLRATGSCRRMHKLGFRVKEIDWALNTVPRAASFVNFIQNEGVSLSTLSLFVSKQQLRKLPLELIFTKAVRRKLPQAIHVACYEENGPFYAGEEVDYFENKPLMDVNKLVQALLRNPKLAELQIAASFCHHTIVHSFPFRSLPPLKVLVLKDLSFVDTDGLKRFITHCTLLEHLEVKQQEINEHSPTLGIVSDSLKSVIFSRMNVKMVTPELLKLHARVGKLDTFGPALQELLMDARWKVSLEMGPDSGDQVRQLRLENIEGSGHWWRNISQIVSKFSASLEVLQLSCRQGLESKEPTKAETITLEELLGSLPPKLGTLSMEGGFLELVKGGHINKTHELECQAPSTLRVLEVELKDIDASYLRLRLLVRALPMLEVLEIKFPRLPDEDIALLGQNDFAKVARVVLRKQ